MKSIQTGSSAIHPAISSENPVNRLLYYAGIIGFSITSVLAFAFLYHGVILHMVNFWMTPDGFHGPLILAASIYLVWIQKEKIRALHPEPALLSGAFFLFAGCFLFFAGDLGSTILIQRVSIIPVLLGGILLFAGFSFFKALLMPVGYLVFLTGFIEQVLESISIYLQWSTAYVAVFFLKLTGMPVFFYDTLIALPHITMDVVRACSGVNHILALLALAVPLAFLTQKSFLRKSILVVSAFFIGIFANGVRVALIGLYTRYNPGAEVHGPDELLYVGFIFFFGMILLLLLSRILSGKRSKRASGSSSANPEDGVAKTSNPPRHSSKSAGRYLPPFIIGMSIFVITFGFVHFYNLQAVALDKPLGEFPAHVAGFTGGDTDELHTRYRPFPADDELLRRYVNDAGITAKLYVGYFREQDRRRKIIDYRRAWMHEEASMLDLNAGGNTVSINHFLQRRGGGKPEYVYFWYFMDGRIIRDEYTGKLATFLSGFFKRKTNAAIIVITTPHEKEDVLPLVTELMEELNHYLPGT